MVGGGVKPATPPINACPPRSFFFVSMLAGAIRWLSEAHYCPAIIILLIALKTVQKPPKADGADDITIVSHGTLSPCRICPTISVIDASSNGIGEGRHALDQRHVPACVDRGRFADHISFPPRTTRPGERWLDQAHYEQHRRDLPGAWGIPLLDEMS